MAAVDSDYLKQMRLREKVPIVQSFVLMILVCVTKKQWELMEENDENMEEQLERDGGDGSQCIH